MKKRKGIRDGAYRHTEDIIRSFHKYPRWIKELEEKLLYPHKEIDANQGTGGNLPSSPTENTAMSLISDNKLQQMKREYEQLLEMLAKTDDKTKRIIELWYIERPQTKTWDGISLEVGLTKRQCFRLRDAFIKELAEKLIIF